MIAQVVAGFIIMMAALLFLAMAVSGLAMEWLEENGLNNPPERRES